MPASNLNWQIHRCDVVREMVFQAGIRDDGLQAWKCTIL